MSIFLGIFSKFSSLLQSFRKKKTVIETLEDIDKQIKDFEKYKVKNEINERKYIGALVIYSVLLYIIGAIFYYIYFMPTKLIDQVKTSIPFFISPIIIYLLRRFLKWFFIKRTKFYAKKLEDLREEKKAILEDVKEKETYKKAKEILERFGNGVEISITPPSSPSKNKTMISATPFGNSQKFGETNLVHRNIKNIQQNQMNMSRNPLNTSNLNRSTNKIGSSGSISSESKPIPTQTLGPIQNQSQQIASPPPITAASQVRTLLPRPIITPNRNFFDKILDFIIGEGPNNRYALICKNCHFHNGMALKEEFEYVAFRCAYCLFYNEARKTKLNVPLVNNKSGFENVIKEKKNYILDESVEATSMSSSDSLNDIDPLSDQLNSEAQKISASQPNLKMNENISKENKVISQSVENLRLDSSSEMKPK
ncbi:lunapark-B isoform X1 [Brachionus plicatilis]|uniref:Endoplasmic reticulum junction formation protein lunapark n=1 Tax=Brachionus plicatilis TaxID=10195 RepID=A0A3M7R341_BRAPC|nr:lunapark-B isoform X1 [Brachionus plicatilis]